LLREQALRGRLDGRRRRRFGVIIKYTEIEEGELVLQRGDLNKAGHSGASRQGTSERGRQRLDAGVPKNIKKPGTRAAGIKKSPSNVRLRINNPRAL